ncbi:hypothetical protein ANCCEY_14618 [Ancylostoma ceylanicum]|uniref:Uncharacterized protein n=1 Tax=Ancylostoma ceylanicum TaxID=53326 RepID=A0A0D6L9F4_9BILA|nr:hypothetical protein ANCCEY_14618 [Ancylostoma ceylanicum]
MHAPTSTTPALRTPVVSPIAVPSSAQAYLPTDTDFHDSPFMVEARKKVPAPSSPSDQSQSSPPFGGETVSSPAQQLTPARKPAVVSGRTFPLKSLALQRKASSPTGTSGLTLGEPQSAAGTAEEQPNSPSVAGPTSSASAPLTSVSGPSSLPTSTSKISSLLAFVEPRPFSCLWWEAGLASTSKISSCSLGAGQDERWLRKVIRVRSPSPRFPQSGGLPSAAPSFTGAASEPQRVPERPKNFSGASSGSASLCIRLRLDALEHGLYHIVQVV